MCFVISIFREPGAVSSFSAHRQSPVSPPLTLTDRHQLLHSCTDGVHSTVKYGRRLGPHVKATLDIFPSCNSQKSQNCKKNHYSDFKLKKIMRTSPFTRKNPKTELIKSETSIFWKRTFWIRLFFPFSLKMSFKIKEKVVTKMSLFLKSNKGGSPAKKRKKGGKTITGTVTIFHTSSEDVSPDVQLDSMKRAYSWVTLHWCKPPTWQINVEDLPSINTEMCFLRNIQQLYTKLKRETCYLVFKSVFKCFPTMLKILNDRIKTIF